MPVLLAPGTQVEIILHPKSFLPTTPDWRRDVDNLIQASLDHPNLWPEARGQHLELINKHLVRNFPDRRSDGLNRQQRRAMERKRKGGKR